jgi:lysophospholipid acyltransferase (LPLAT)-like uncharacterized protein
MKIRQPWLIRAGATAGASALRLWMNGLRFEYRPLGANVDPHRADLAGRYIYAIWHEYLLLPVFCYTRPDVHVLISRHADGEWVAQLCRRLRIPVIRGSTTRGGAEAVRRLLRAGRETHLALTPDGPRGPRRRIQGGAIFLAARLGLPIVAVGFGLRRCWRMKSWDRFAIPGPWTRATCVTGVPIVVPASVNRQEIEHYRLQVEQSLTGATETAERWALTGAFKPEPALAA